MTLPFIMVAPTGARHSKADHPALPLNTSQILDEAAACADAGADALHLHVRDDTGAHSLSVRQYRKTITALADAVPNMRIQVTTESAGRFNVPEQLACLEDLQPDWASVSVREIARAPQLAHRLYHGCAERGTQVQHILYDPSDSEQLSTWQAAGVVPPEHNSVILVLGRYEGGRDAAVSDLDPFLAALPDGMDWMVCAFGPNEHACLTAGAARGGALRVGFENSLTTADGTPHASNAASVAALIRRLNGGRK